jgi:hypothetical protein
MNKLQQSLGNFEPVTFTAEEVEENECVGECVMRGIKSLQPFKGKPSVAAAATKSFVQQTMKLVKVKAKDVSYALAEVTVKESGLKLLVTLADLGGNVVPVRAIDPVAKTVYLPSQIWVPMKLTRDSKWEAVLAISFGTEPPPGSKVLEAIPVD